MEAVLVYKGASLSHEVREWAEKQSTEYPYFVEVSHKLVLAKFIMWADVNLTKGVHLVQVNPHFPARKMCSAQYCIAPRTRFLDSGFFYGFVSHQDRELFIKYFKEFVVHENPFVKGSGVEK